MNEITVTLQTTPNQCKIVQIFNNFKKLHVFQTLQNFQKTSKIQNNHESSIIPKK